MELTFIFKKIKKFTSNKIKSEFHYFELQF